MVIHYYFVKFCSDIYIQASQATSTSAPAPGYSSAPTAASPELEQTLQKLSSHRTVLGVLLLSRASPPSIIRHSGVVFDGEQGRKYAKAVGRIVDACKAGLDDIDSETVCLS